MDTRTGDLVLIGGPRRMWWVVLLAYWWPNIGSAGTALFTCACPSVSHQCFHSAWEQSLIVCFSVTADRSQSTVTLFTCSVSTVDTAVSPPLFVPAVVFLGVFMNFWFWSFPQMASLSCSGLRNSFFFPCRNKHLLSFSASSFSFFCDLSQHWKPGADSKEASASASE